MTLPTPTNLLIKTLSNNAPTFTLKEIWDIFKRMFGLLREQSSLWTPILRMVFFNLCLLSLFIIGVASFIKHYETTSSFIHPGVGALLILIAFLGYLFRTFYFGYLLGLISGMVILYLRGGQVTLKDARQVVKAKIITLASLHFLIQIMGIFLIRKKNTIQNPDLATRTVFTFVTTESMDLLSHFLVPVIITERTGLTQSLLHLKSLREHLPATLAGIFGVDMTKKILTLLFIPFSLGFLFLCYLIAAHYVNAFPSDSVISFFNFTFSWIPLLIGFLFLFFINSFLRPCMDGLKIIYFTLLYTLMCHPDTIRSKEKEEFINLLKPR